MRVRFDNYGDLVLATVGNASIDIPRGSEKKATFRDLPDTEAVHRGLQNLTRRHPFLHVTIEEEGASAELEAPEKVDGEPTDEGAAPVLSLEEFQERVASVVKGAAGWWTVEIKGRREPMKVRSAASDKNAIELAYEEYKEDIE